MDDSLRIDLEGRMILDSVHARLFGSEPEPTMIGYHKVLERLGFGGMGEVYLALNTEVNRLEALKVLRAGPGRPREDEVRLKHEAEALALLSHPNVVQLYRSSVQDGELRLAMEYVRGPTLKQWQDADPRGWRELLAVYIAAGRGLEAAHRAGLVHRDFKPTNVILGEEGTGGHEPAGPAPSRVRVIDFGLAIRGDAALGTDADAGANAGAETGHAERVTRKGDLIGTPFYMSPEQCKAGPLTAQSDQFSFCVTLYQALYRQHPYYVPDRVTTPSRVPTDHAESQPATAPVDLQALKRAICEGRLREPPPGSRVPRRLFRILARGLEQAPDRRYPAMHELLAALERELAPSLLLRYATVGLTAGLLAAAAVAFLREGPPAVCGNLGDQLRGVWDDERAAAVRATFEATGASFATAAYEAVEGDLVAYANEWKTAHEAACSDTYRSGSQDVETYQKRRMCLLERREALAQTVDALTRANIETVIHARDNVDGLPRIEECENPLILAQACTIAGASEAMLDAMPQLRAAVARTAAFERVGDYQSAVQSAAIAVAEARRSDLPPWIAETLFVYGRLLLHRRDFAAAHVALDEAYRVALSVGCQDLAIDAANRLTKLFGLDDRPGPRLDQDWSSFVRGALAALGDMGGTRMAEALHNRGLVHERRLGDLGRAEADYHESLRLRERLDPQPLAGMAVTNQNLGAVLDKLGRPQEGLAQFELALERATKAYGSGHPELWGYYLNMGKALGKAKQPAKAEEYLSRGLSLVQRAHGAKHRKAGEAHLELAQFFDDLDRTDLALEHARSAEQILAELGEGHELLRQARLMLSYVQNKAGKHEEALLLRRWLLAQAAPDDREELSMAHLELAQTLLALERWREALEHGLAARDLAVDDEVRIEADVCIGLSIAALGRSG